MHDDLAPRLTRGQVSDLAEHMATVLTTAMRTETPEPLAEAAWFAAKAVRQIANLLPAGGDESSPVDERRADLFGDVVACTDHIRRAIHTQQAAEAPLAVLARHTEDDVLADTGLGWNLALDEATVRVTLPDAQTHVEVTLTKTPDGAWSWNTDDLPLPLGPVTGHDHLELHALLTGVGTLITGALHPDLLEER
ncbi:hypothetical protein ACFQ68_13245 [Amycolatopsis japonica]|uniref:hypothetical protein n=1 Tax=Amycolatopsis japonica TaxID=208439 RepID=UPI00366E2523